MEIAAEGHQAAPHLSCIGSTRAGIREMLDLHRPIYRATATYGHFGREESNFSWERTDKAEALSREVSSKTARGARARA